ncbi:hypothetical protein [Formosa sp. A9]|uniref:hypothetical protein n=1 Tax=Formosa sp. A9 TaxID=3442641 RepID=UPI003EB88E52
MIPEDFINHGFKREDDPMFRFRKELVSEEYIADNGIREDEIPCLLFGSTGINKGFCIYTGEHFVWFNSTTIEDAIAFAEKIVAFEPV